MSRDDRISRPRVDRFLHRVASLLASQPAAWRLDRIDLDSRSRLTALASRDDGQGGTTYRGFSESGSDVADLDVADFEPTRDPKLFKRNPMAAVSARVGLPASPARIAGYRPLKRVVCQYERDGRASYLKIRKRRLSDPVLALIDQGLPWPRLERRAEAGEISVELWAPAGSRTLRDCLTDADRNHRLEQVGQAAAALAASHGGAADRLPARPARGLIERTRIILERQALIDPGALRPIGGLIDHLADEIDAAAGDRPLYPAHGDLHDGQIFFDGPDGDEVRFIDPDSLCRAPLEFDVANLAAHLVLDGVRRNPDSAPVPAGGAEESLTGSFRRALPEPARSHFSPTRFALLKRLCLLRLAGVYGSRPAWRRLAQPLADAATGRTPGPGPRIRRSIAAAVLATTTLGALAAPGSAAVRQHGASSLRDGLWVEVQGEHRPGKRFKVDEVEVKAPSEGRRRQVHAHIDAFDPATGLMTLLDLTIRVTSDTELVDADGTRVTIDRLDAGVPVKAAGFESGREGIPTVREIRILPDDNDEAEVEGYLTHLSHESHTVKFEINGVSMRLSTDAEITVRPDAEAFLAPPLDVSSVSRSRSDEDWQPPGRALIHPSLTLGGRINARVTSESGLDLNRASNDDIVESNLHTRAYARWAPSPWIEAYGELRWTGHEPPRTDPADLAHGRTELESGPTYLLLRPAVFPYLALQAGRVDLEEDREWFYDENLDGMRLLVTTWQLRAEVGAYRTDITPTAADDDEEYWVMSVGAPRSGPLRPEVVHIRRSDRRASADRRSWTGARLPLKVGPMRTWSDWVWARGDYRGMSVRSWATDWGWLLRWDRRFRGSIYAGYAFATGDPDRGDGVDREFRDTGLADNTDAMDGLKSFRYYGELTDPELSNLRVVTIGAGAYLTRWLSIDCLLHEYRQHQLRDRFRSEVAPRPSGNSRDLGHEIDIVAGIRGSLPVDLEIAWSRFTPGLAFDTRDPATQLKVVIEWRR